MSDELFNKLLTISYEFLINILQISYKFLVDFLQPFSKKMNENRNALWCSTLVCALGLKHKLLKEAFYETF